jgi:predicted nuclease of predicted toxin-antitoxin system
LSNIDRSRKKARFLVDESLGPEVANVLKEYKYNAVFTSDVHLSGHDDSSILGYAWKHKRMLLTHDQGFLDDRKYPHIRNPGIVILPGAQGDENSLIRALSDVIFVIGKYALLNRGLKIVIDEGGIWTITGFNKATGLHYKQRLRFEKNGGILEWSE